MDNVVAYWIGQVIGAMLSPFLFVPAFFAAKHLTSKSVLILCALACAVLSSVIGLALDDLSTARDALMRLPYRIIASLIWFVLFFMISERGRKREAEASFDDDTDGHLP